MKTTLTCAGLGLAVAVMFGLGFANAGTGPLRSRSFSGGCASAQQYTMQAEASGGCCSQVLVGPAYKDSGCHGGNVTLSERSTARRAAKANYNKTLAACLAAAAKGELEVVEGAAMTTMKMVPVTEDCP